MYKPKLIIMNKAIELRNLVIRKTIENQGCSINLNSEIPDKGFMVSLKGHELQVNILEFSLDHIDRFIDDNIKLLSNRKCFIGTWVENDIVFIDVSINLKNKRASLAFAQDNGQIAIFDVLQNKTVYLLNS
jgi:hypothetical protein